MMVKVTNSSKSRQAVHTTTGVVFIQPGASRDVELSEPGAKFVDNDPNLSIATKQARKSTRNPVSATSTDTGADDQPEANDAPSAD